MQGGQGRIRTCALALTALLLAAAAPTAARADQTYSSGGVFARVTPNEVVLGNQLAERRWAREGFRTEEITDRRGAGRRAAGERRDFALTVAGAELGSDAFRATTVSVRTLPHGGVRVTMSLAPSLAAPPLRVTRVAEAYPGVAGFRTQTTVESPIPLVLSRARLEEAGVGSAAPTLSAFRAGGDWREPEWQGPQLTVGDPHPGTWRDTRTAQSDQPLEGPGEWISLAAGPSSLFMVAERNDFPSSRGAYDGHVASVQADYSRDVLSLGPLEEQGHVENDVVGTGRGRVLHPGVPLPLDAVFTGLGRGDGDEAWQFHRYLTDHRLVPYRHAVTFNSNGTDSNRISTGAKDDVDYATVKEIAPIAKRLGVETFILDDGWQARSGDWQPDSPQYPEPRWDGVQGSKFAPRFPDATFRAVRREIAPMRLGLWMSPTFFNPSSRAYQDHPEWTCSPVGNALAVQNQAQPDDGSNEAGEGAFGPAALPHVESRIRDAIVNWHVAYFKFDFLLWLDCAGQGDLYEFHDAFVAMLDRLRAAYPRVTFEIDETNDYRLFPFESVSRGPTWFQNGGPTPSRMLHNLWNLSPYVPTFALGQNALANDDFARYPVDTLMTAALLSHITFFEDPRRLPASVVDRVAPWTTFYKRNRKLLGGVVYPLLDDPLKGGWTALQAWDPDAGRGALLTFRQDSGDSSRTVALRNVPAGRRFELLEGPRERPVGVVTSAELTQGINVTLPGKEDAKVLLVKPASGGGAR